MTILKNVDLKKLQAEITQGDWDDCGLKTPYQPMVMQCESSAKILPGEQDQRFICSVGCESPSGGWNGEDYANAKAIALVPEMIARILELEALFNTFVNRVEAQAGLSKREIKNIRAALGEK